MEAPRRKLPGERTRISKMTLIDGALVAHSFTNDDVPSFSVQAARFGNGGLGVCAEEVLRSILFCSCQPSNVLSSR